MEIPLQVIPEGKKKNKKQDNLPSLEFSFLVKLQDFLCVRI